MNSKPNKPTKKQLKADFAQQHDRFQSQRKLDKEPQFNMEYIRNNPAGTAKLYKQEWEGRTGKFSEPKYKRLNKRDLAQIVLQHLDAELAPALRQAGLQSEISRYRAYAMDDIFGMLKKGASMLWDNRHELFPTYAPLVDKALNTAKGVLGSLGINVLPEGTMKAIATNHVSPGLLTNSDPTTSFTALSTVKQQSIPKGMVIQGIDRDALMTVFAPLNWDVTKLKRFPYGATPSSFYTRQLTYTITNLFTDGTGANPQFSAKMAFLIAPTKGICTCVPLTSNYQVTFNGSISPGALASSIVTGVQQGKTIPLFGLPTFTSYRLLGSQIRSEYQGNMLNIAGRHMAVSLRYPEESGSFQLVQQQRQIYAAGVQTAGYAPDYKNTNGIGCINTWDPQPLGYQNLILQPDSFTMEPTYVSSPVSQSVSSSMPAADIEDLTYCDNMLSLFDNTGKVVGKTDANNTYSTGYAGTMVTSGLLDAASASLGEIHIIVYDGMPTTTQLSFQIVFTAALEAVLTPSQQYQNQPRRPDYSKGTLDKLLELQSLEPNIWTMNVDDSTQLASRI